MFLVSSDVHQILYQTTKSEETGKEVKSKKQEAKSLTVDYAGFTSMLTILFLVQLADQLRGINILP